MARPGQFETPPPAFGVASVVLGTVGMMLFFLPILGAPISAIGILGGIVGGCFAVIWRSGDLRWSLVGVFVSCLALGVNVALDYAPRGLQEPPTGPQTRSVPDRPYVPPPARASR